MVNLSGLVRDYEAESERDLGKIKKYGIINIVLILIEICFLGVKSLVEVSDAIYAASVSVCVVVVVLSLVTLIKIIVYTNKYFFSWIPPSEGE